MVERGGGCRDLERARARRGEQGVVVVHVYVDVGDAMGANMVDTVAEALAPDPLHALVGGTVGPAHLSNLCARRMVTRAGAGVAGDARRRRGGRRHRAGEPLRRPRPCSARSRTTRGS
jgi:hydroxymethylglutaryl-CoA reductase